MTALTSDPGDAGEERWPPGFRFHPTDEELVAYYLKRKMCRRSLKLDVITETDVYKWDPDELPGQSILKTGDRQWFFFSPRERKYPNAGRSNRATAHGYWKATGKDRNVTCSSRTVGIKKTLVYYRGRAPNGDRTDWVMHEYTLDEEELKRCVNVKDYYALYKVYKKSGPGPKNGEQYGAPFKEEEWADEEDRITTNKMVVSEVREKQVDVAPAHNLQVVAQAQPPVDEIDEFMKRILDEPLLPQQQITDFASFLQAVSEEDSQITLVDPSSGQITVPHSTTSSATNGGQYNEQVNFGLTQLGPSNPQVYETPEVTSATSNWNQAPHLAGEEGFLEIDDLDKELGSSFEQKPVDNLQLFDDFDDLFQDADMYLHGTGPINQGTVSQSFNLENGTVSQPIYHLQSSSFTNQEQYQLPVASQVADYQFQANSAVVNQQIWAVEQNDTFTPSQSCQPAGSVPSSGVPEGNQNNNNNRGDDGAEPSWMSSVLWSFVESIPTTPASASESPLVNRAFERMSSFSRLRLNPRNNDIIAADNSGPPTVTRTTVNNNKKGFLLISIIGALVAVLWVLFSTVRIMGRVVFS